MRGPPPILQREIISIARTMGRTDPHRMILGCSDCIQAPQLRRADVPGMHAPVAATAKVWGDR